MKKKQEKKPMKVVIKYLNKPSEQAINNFHKAFYNLVIDVLNGKYDVPNKK